MCPVSLYRVHTAEAQHKILFMAPLSITNSSNHRQKPNTYSVDTRPCTIPGHYKRGSFSPFHRMSHPPLLHHHILDFSSPLAISRSVSCAIGDLGLAASGILLSASLWGWSCCLLLLLLHHLLLLILHVLVHLVRHADAILAHESEVTLKLAPCMHSTTTEPCMHSTTTEQSRSTASLSDGHAQNLCAVHVFCAQHALTIGEHERVTGDTCTLHVYPQRPLRATHPSAHGSSERINT